MPSDSLPAAQEGTRDWPNQGQLFHPGCAHPELNSVFTKELWDLLDHQNLGKTRGPRLSSVLLSPRPSGPRRDVQVTHLDKHLLAPELHAQ